MRVYVDQLAVYFTFTNSINTQLFIAPGQHTVEVMAEDKQGYISSTILNVTVTSQPSAESRTCPDGNPAPPIFLPALAATDKSAPPAIPIRPRLP